MSPGSRKRVVLFIGPTLGDQHQLLPTAGAVDWDPRPPAAQGDLYLAAQEKPWGIALVDGYFERLPAVWHKEILWALERGIHVFGAASMGALRAAELDRFGMLGVGEAYRAFAAGELEDDDEVTLIHGPDESGYLPLSEAMINIRATLKAAEDQGVLSSKSHADLLRQAKETFYPHRNWPALQRENEHLQAFWRWLESGRVDQKRLDLLELIAAVEHRAREGAPPAVAGEPVEDTVFWRDLRRESAARTEPHRNAEAEQVLMQLRLWAPDTYRQYRRRAQARRVALGNENLAATPGTESLRPTVQSFRRRFQLTDAESMERWLDQQDLSADRLLDLLSDQHRLTRARPGRSPALSQEMCDLLRLDGLYAHWRRRADEAEIRQRELEKPPDALSASNSDHGSHGISDPFSDNGLWQRFFDRCLQRPAPEPVAAYAAELDFPDLPTFRRLVEIALVSGEEPEPVDDSNVPP